MRKYIIISILFIAVIISGIMSVSFIKNISINNVVDEDGERIINLDQIVYISLEPLLKIEYQEIFKACPNIKENRICSSITTKVTNIELLNDEAKILYYDYNYDNKDIYLVIEDIINIATNNNYDTSNVDIIYTSGNFTVSNIDINPLININDDFQDSIDKQTVMRLYRNYYSVIFDTDGGSPIVNQNINKNELVREPVIPTKEGYIFLGWELNGDSYDFNVPVTEDIVLKAIWQEIDLSKEKYTIIFDTDGGSKIRKQIVKYGELVKEPKNPTKKGNEFIGWTLNGEQYDFSSPVTSNLTLVANWETIKKN